MLHGICMLRRLFTRGLIQQHQNPVESFHAVEFKPHSVPIMLICSMPWSDICRKNSTAYYFWLTATCEAGNQGLPTPLLSTDSWSTQGTIVAGGAGLCNFCFLFVIACQAVECTNENLAPVAQIYVGLSLPLHVFERLAMSSVHCCETQMKTSFSWKEWTTCSTIQWHNSKGITEVSLVGTTSLGYSPWHTGLISRLQLALHLSLFSMSYPEMVLHVQQDQ